MPKANDVTITTETAVADPMTAETVAAEEKAVDTAEKTVEAAEKTEKTAPAKRGPKKGSTRKSTSKKAEKTETVYIQVADQEFEMSVIMDKVRAATKSVRAVHEINVYVKPEENRAYYVAKKTKGEVVGSVEI